MRKTRWLAIVCVSVALGAVVAGGASRLSTSPPSARPSASARVPGYGGPVGELETPVPGSSVNELEAAQAPREAKRVKGSFIVALQPGQDPQAVAASIARDYGGEPGAVYDHVIDGFQFVGPDDAGQRMASDPRIRSVQPDYEAHVAEGSGIPLAHNVAIDQPAAISAGNNGHGVRIGILDTGADLNHVDLAGQVSSDSTDASGNNCSTRTGSAQDSNGHGTRTTSNAVGLNGIGTAPGAKAVVVKVFPGNQGSTSFALIACGLNYIVGLNSDGTTANDVQVVNASIAGGGGSGTCTDGGLRQAVCTLVNGTTFNGHTITTHAPFFAAAGNSGVDTSGIAPANFPEAIAVSAFDCSSTNCSTTAPRFVHSTQCVSAGVAWSSDYGSTVDLGAPGNDIYSSKLGGGHELACGTSRASPQVAGAAADLLSAVPGLTPAQIKTDLRKGGICPDRATNNVDGNCASSRGAWSGDPDGTGAVEPFLDVNGAIHAAAPPTPAAPSAPTNVTAVAGNGQATVSWTASPPANPAIDFYKVTSNPGGFTAQTANGTTTSAPVTGLQNGTPYTFTVQAHNSQGFSPPSSASSAVTPSAPTVPVAPTNAHATAGNAQASVTWSASSSNGGAAIDFYKVTSNPGGFTAQTPNGTTTSATVTGLQNGTSYTFTVQAHNSVGFSSPSLASNAVTPTATVTTTRVEDSSSSVTYSSGWTRYSLTSCVSGGSYTATKTANATANFSFTGNEIRWYGETLSSGGQAQVFVDGTLKTTVSLYAASQGCVVRLFDLTVPYGSHTIQVKATGTHVSGSTDNWVIVDAFDYVH